MGIGAKLVGLGVAAFAGYLVIAVARDPRPVIVGPAMPTGFAAASPGAGSVTTAYEPTGTVKAVPPAPVQPARPVTVIPESLRNAELVDLTVVPKMRSGSAVAVLGFKLKSRAEVALKDIAIRCEFFGESGTRLADVRRVAYRTLPAKKTLAIDELNFGFVHSESRQLSCRVTEAQTA